MGHPRRTHSRYVIDCCLIPLGICGLKNNLRRITYGIGCVWGMPSLSPLSSLGHYTLRSNLTVHRTCAVALLATTLKCWIETFFLLLFVMNRGQNDPDFRNISYIPTACSKCVSAFNLLLACSRLSDSGEDAKEKGRRKVGGREFSCLHFLNSADPTIWEPGAG